MGTRKEKISLFDRIVISILSGALAFMTGAFIWFVAVYVLAFTISINNLTFTPVIIFSAFMACLGFLTKTNPIADILGAIWHVIYKVAKTWL